MFAIKQPVEPLKTERAEFSKKTKAEAFLRAGGRCECGCGARLTHENVEYDHDTPCALGGDNSIDNCRAYVSGCHLEKTKDDVSRIAKTKRQHNKHHGIVTRQRKATIPSRPMPGSRASGFKKNMDGSVERRNPQRAGGRAND